VSRGASVRSLGQFAADAVTQRRVHSLWQDARLVVEVLPLRNVISLVGFRLSDDAIRHDSYCRTGLFLRHCRQMLRI